MAVSETHYRPEQRAIIDGYKGGRIGIVAVPGSGKTFTLSHLAARLVERLIEGGDWLDQSPMDRQEVLVVTFTNTAVNSFRSRIADILRQERGLLPYVGYRVRTLHGLAHDIVRERPALVGLADDFQIVDERVAESIIRDVAQSLFNVHLDVFTGYINPEAASSEKQARRIEQQELPELAVKIAQQFVKHAKDNLLDPVQLRAALEAAGVELPLARYGVAVYEDYQRSLSYRGAVDFDDLVRLAIMALQSDESFLRRLRTRWQYILEDEAQDSSRLQEQMLRLLGGDKNWVRVGDPNQAINTTFTTANPRFLRHFLTEDGVKEMPLHTSGRSAQPIIDLANTLVRWTARHHLVPQLKVALLEQEIRPTRRGDPQPNPPADGCKVHIHYKPGENVAPELELELVASSIERYVAENPDRTVAALIPDNKRAYELVEILKMRSVPYEDDLLRSTTATRRTVAMIRAVLDYLGSPLNTAALVRLYRGAWWVSHLCTLERDSEQEETITKALTGCRQVETFLWPTPGNDWLDSKNGLNGQDDLRADLAVFRQNVQVWLQGASLPIDQLVLTVTRDLFTDPSDIALGYQVALLLRAIARNNLGWRLPEFSEELRVISENGRKFIDIDDAERGYSPRPGQVTISTMHGAKGLEWDRVYLLAVNNYDFPSADVHDEFRSERWFIRSGLNLEAEALAQLDMLHESSGAYVEGEATAQARLDYAAERLRLLYVGITRARRDLVITWNMGRFWQRGGNAVKQAALPLVVLWEYQEGTLKL